MSLNLTENKLLLNNLPQGVVEIINAKGARYYQGYVENKNGSWARMYEIDNIWSGVVFFDESQLWLIEIADEEGDVSPTQKKQYKLFKAEDIVSSLLIDHGGIEEALNESSSVLGKNQHSNYPISIDEGIEASGENELHVLTMTIIIDNSYVKVSGSREDAISDVIAHVNVVDGIFSEQVGVGIKVDYLDTVGADVLTTPSGPDLLREFRTYLITEQNIPLSGANHLITAKGNLVGSEGSPIRGIATLGTLCTNRAQAATNLNQKPAISGSITFAHEIGHNFGATHINENGGSCANQTGIMRAPSAGTTFTDCSLKVFEETIKTAQCFNPPQSTLSLESDNDLYPQSGYWFDPDDPGTGINLDIQNGIVAGNYYGYHGSGDDTWLQFSGALKRRSSDAIYSIEADLIKFGRGLCLINCNPGSANNNMELTYEVLGKIKLSFDSLTTARLSLDGETVSEIELFSFGNRLVSQESGLNEKVVDYQGTWNLVFDAIDRASGAASRQSMLVEFSNPILPSQSGATGPARVHYSVQYSDITFSDLISAEGLPGRQSATFSCVNNVLSFAPPVSCDLLMLLQAGSGDDSGVIVRRFEVMIKDMSSNQFIGISTNNQGDDRTTVRITGYRVN